MQYPCTGAMVTNVITLKPDQTVEEALTIFRDRDIRNLPVVDEKGQFLGLFGLQQVIFNLLPKAATMADGMETLKFVVDAAPGIAKRLKKLHHVAVSEIMNTDVAWVDCETPTIEAIRMMATKGSPIVVKDKETGAFKGVISRETLLANLYEILEEIEKASEEE